MVSALLDAGTVSPLWADAMRAVPRHQFIPDTVYRADDTLPGHDLVPLRRAVDPGTWLELVYSGDVVITQVDDGHPPGGDGPGWESSSSASMPAVVADMLHELDPKIGENVLEIGTGTGWNAALMAWRVGAENITTLEIDPKLADHARDALDATGYRKVRVVCADGILGWPHCAPYDRLIATVGAYNIPYPWIEQVKPGGRIVVPISNTYYPPGIAVLTRHADGTASGGLAGRASFMELRCQRTRRGTLNFVADPDVKTTTGIHPYRLAGDRDAAVAIGQRVSGIRHIYIPKTDTTGRLWLHDPGTRSWALLELTDNPPYPVEQAGPRRLFNEVVDAYRWWQEAGEPKATDWTITVGRNGQHLTLNSTSNP